MGVWPLAYSPSESGGFSLLTGDEWCTLVLLSMLDAQVEKTLC